MKPPRLADQLLKLFCAPHRLEEVQGDLHEEFAWQVRRVGEWRARWRYWRDVLGFLKPFATKRKSTPYYSYSSLSPVMVRNYFKTAWRNLLNNKGYSAINIIGLSVGMAVAMLIGLWIYDELSFNQYHQNHNRIAQVLENQTLEEGIQTYGALPFPLSRELRTNYPDDFKTVVANSWAEQILAYQDQKFTRRGSFAEPEFPEMFSLKMRSGSRSGLKDPASILLSESVAKALFGDADPLHKTIKVGNKYNVQVTGVYEDLPHNTLFQNLGFVAPIELIFSEDKDRLFVNNWRSSSFEIFAQLNPNSRFDDVSRKIRDVFRHHTESKSKPALFLHPMSRWHLYSEFKNGVSTGGRIQFVWLFGIIGGFVLLLACINFMNLSTARSQKRAKEVGIRKAIGSQRSQIIGQFFSESFLVVALSFVLSLLLVQIALPVFNEVAGKQMAMLWSDARFWLLSIGFILFTGLVAGSYPALYLSSFQPIKVLKGTFNLGRLATIPRKVLVVVQFTVSVTLIIGTILVFRQIQFAKNRPLGYNYDGLINITMNTPELQGRYDRLRNELLATGAVANMAEASSPATNIWSSANNLDWRGKNPEQTSAFGTICVTPEFGDVVGWKIKEGRGFSRQFSTDSMTFVLNEAAVKQTGLKKPVGETIRWHDQNWKVIGVVKDMVMTSPFDPVVPTVFMMNTRERTLNFIHIKLNPAMSAGMALEKLETVFEKINPDAPFEYKFADQEFATKFAAEERIGKLASFFAGLAIFISCLGIFGLASFIAEQRTKEIGVRKVLGASVANLWGLLSKDFVLLVIISCVISSPIAWYFLNDWLQKYEYRTEISWWIFAAAGFGSLFITLLTVSFQSIKAALMNPVKSLRSE
ncbi:ABC transporter permease [Larkinella rosea]|uniref:FtsX-like permease family protein n=1 Tax=Larkinella rosea TaxID=2025312 RepID=A0A3P1BFW5_9BACT|nr:ABC transporter permease [Larkinella rosea]RRA99979.1 FtsX-like permease family protein [Larkinella rosea]